MNTIFPSAPPKPGQVKVVRALYRYSAQQPDELSFEEGDTLYIIDKQSNLNWWKASCKGNTGLIPSNYVEENTEEVLHPLHEAAKRGNLEFMKECLENKVSVNGLDKAGCTALHWASHAGHIDCVDALLKTENCQVNVQNKLGDTPLHNAAWKGHLDVAKVLIHNGGHPTLINNDGKQPFNLATDPAMVAYLKEYYKLSSTISPEDYGDSEDSE